MSKTGLQGKGMAQALTEGTRSGPGSTEKIANVVLWMLQIAAAGMFLMVGYLKLSGMSNWLGCLRPSASGSGSVT